MLPISTLRPIFLFGYLTTCGISLRALSEVCSVESRVFAFRLRRCSAQFGSRFGAHLCVRQSWPTSRLYYYNKDIQKSTPILEKYAEEPTMSSSLVGTLKTNLEQLKRYQAWKTHAARLLGGWLPGVAQWEIKQQIGYHLWEDLRHSQIIRRAYGSCASPTLTAILTPPSAKPLSDWRSRSTTMS